MLNNAVTLMLIILIVSLQEFAKKPFYCVYTFGPFLWSIYHVLLALLVWRFLKDEGQSISSIIGSREASLNSIMLVLGLILLSFLIFQILEPIVSNVVYGPGMMRQLLEEYRSIPMTIVVYTIVVTSLTAGVCEEIIWRGYLQTRLDNKLSGKTGIAIVIQAILFGLWHGTSIHAVFTTIFGLIYGLVYAKMKRLMPVIVGHWLGDALGFSYMYFMMA